MRTVLIGDAVAAARALLPLPRASRPAMMARLIDEAHQADCCRKRLGRWHPRFGNGTLMDAASRYPQPREPFLDDPDYLDCLLVVLAALLARRVPASGRGELFSDLRLSCETRRA
ncbi:hypothetical protein [Halodurantibacterium flavum]|uniref:DUF7742 domain-containing protein n=1 Tax=Halodurantibacterium flavum TaxID=1382802 RepID=A0ABW4S3P7_9RHOB